MSINVAASQTSNCRVSNWKHYSVLLPLTLYTSKICPRRRRRRGKKKRFIQSMLKHVVEQPAKWLVRKIKESIKAASIKSILLYMAAGSIKTARLGTAGNVFFFQRNVASAQTWKESYNPPLGWRRARKLTHWMLKRNTIHAVKHARTQLCIQFFSVPSRF